jgi:hypothetical protein
VLCPDGCVTNTHDSAQRPSTMIGTINSPTEPKATRKMGYRPIKARCVTHQSGASLRAQSALALH